MEPGSGKLFSGSNDKTVKIWDCWTGQVSFWFLTILPSPNQDFVVLFDEYIICFLQCVQVVTMEGEVGCIISEGQWVLVGVPNAVKVKSCRPFFLEFIDLFECT